MGSLNLRQGSQHCLSLSETTMDAKAKQEKLEKRNFYKLDLKERTRPRQSLNVISMDAKAKKKFENLLKKYLTLKNANRLVFVNLYEKFPWMQKQKTKKQKIQS